MTDQKQKPERFEPLPGAVPTYSGSTQALMRALETISAQLDWLIDQMYGQKQDEQEAPDDD